MQLPSLPVAVFASLPAAEEVTMEATVTLKCSSTHEMMVMENVLVNLAETVLKQSNMVSFSSLLRV